LTPGDLRKILRTVAARQLGEAGAQLQEKFLDMIDEGLFDLAFLRFLADGQEVKNVRIFECIAREVGLWRRQRRGKVVRLIVPRDTPLQIRFDLHDEDVA